MQTPRSQGGWYTGAYLITAVIALVLFMSQPWIPLLLLAAMAGAGVVIALTRGADWLQHWYHDHHFH